MNVFICSTFRDLSLERNCVALAIEHQGYHALGQEDCLPLYERPLELCLEDVRSSHLLLAIIGWCYGSAPAGHKKSFVHLEYEEAKAANIPQLIFLLEQHPEWGCVNKDSEPEHIVHLRESMRRENHCVSIEQSDCLLDVANDLLKRMEFLHAENNLLDLNHSRIQTRVIPFAQGYLPQLSQVEETICHAINLVDARHIIFVVPALQEEASQYFQDLVRYRIIPEYVAEYRNFVSFRIDITSSGLKHFRNESAAFLYVFSGIRAYLGKLFVGRVDAEDKEIVSKMSRMRKNFIVRCYMEASGSKTSFFLLDTTIQFWIHFLPLITTSKIFIFINVAFAKYPQWCSILRDRYRYMCEARASPVILQFLHPLEPVSARDYIRVILNRRFCPDVIEHIASLVPDRRLPRREIVPLVRSIIRHGTS